MNIYLKEKWSEDEVLSLPLGEQDFWDRKSGKGIENTKSNPKELAKFKTELAKDLSAFANSGGGHLIFGIRDNGSIDGVDEFYSTSERTREWLEKMVSTLIVYPLKDFRVHEVSLSSLTKLPEGKTIIVIDIGDSKLAPHQSFDSKIYYHRVGSHSKPAGHHYISLLFGRSRFPSKEVADSWIRKVINPLMDYLAVENENLEQKRRLWEVKEEYFFYGSFQPIITLLTNDSTIYDFDTLEQFLDFTPQIEELLVEHDQIKVKINEQFNMLYDEIEKLPMITEHFKDITTTEKLLELAKTDFDLEKYKQEDLYHQIIGFDNDEKKALNFIFTLMINKLTKWNGNRTFNLFWEKEGENIISFLKYPPLLSFDQQIDNSYKDCHEINLELIKQLKEKRKNLSIEFGIPVR
jgi:Putative DNA-binding domain